MAQVANLRHLVLLPISGNETFIEIIDMKGSVIYSTTCSQQSLEINLENQAKGVFIIRMNSGDNLKQEKLVIE